MWWYDLLVVKTYNIPQGYGKQFGDSSDTCGTSLFLPPTSTLHLKFTWTLCDMFSIVQKYNSILTGYITAWFVTWMPRNKGGCREWLTLPSPPQLKCPGKKESREWLTLHSPYWPSPLRIKGIYRQLVSLKTLTTLATLLFHFNHLEEFIRVRK